MYCLKINYNLFTHGPTHYDPFSASGTYENYRLQLFLTYIHTYIPGIHKFVKIKVGCGISYKHTKNTKYAVLKI